MERRPPLPPRPSKENLRLLKAKQNLRKVQKPEERLKRKQREFKEAKYSVSVDEKLNSTTYAFRNLDINFYDEDRIDREVITPTLRHARRNGMTKNADVNVSITYQSDPANERYDAYKKKKTFNSFQIKNIQHFYDDVAQYNLTNLEASALGYDRVIAFMKITIVQENRGGCYEGGHDKKTLINETTFLISPRSRNNNCFFALFKDILDLRYHRKTCNEIRKDYNLPKDSPLPFSIAVKILKKYVKEGRTYELAKNETKEIFSNAVDSNPDITGVLLGGHYYGHVKRTLKRCDKCLKKYVKEHKCNSNMINYVNNKILKNGKRHLITKFNKNSYNNKNEVLHYDLETFRNILIALGYDIHSAYIVGYTQGDEGFKFIAGNDCMSKFLDEIIKRGDEIKTRWLTEGNKETKTIKAPKLFVNAFNGANFDHYFIQQELLKRGIKPKTFLMNNGSIISLEFENVKMWDLCKHTQGSLKDNLIDWKCETLKGDFNHDDATSWENMSDDLRNDCLKYLEGDVMGLKELYDKMNDTIFNKYSVNLTSYISTSSLAFNIWKGGINGKFDIRLPTSKQEKDFRKAVIGARTYPSKKRFKSKQYNDYLSGKINFVELVDYLIDADVVSLYPTAMMMEFPVGDFIETKDDDCMLIDPSNIKIGIYNIDYESPKNLLHSRIGQRDSKGSLKWNLANKKNQWLTSVDIEDMLKEGYEIKINRGYYTEESRPVFAEYIEEMFQAKKNSKKGTASYLLAKLFMNALYGKMIQRPIPTKTTYIKTNPEYWKFWSDNFITDIVEFKDEKGKPLWHVSGIPRNEEALEETITKPTHFGAFILAYSRRIMYNYMKKANPNGKIEEDFYYTDTDSLQMHQKQTNRIKNLGNKNLGGITDDLGDGCKILRGLWLAPKLYMLEYVKKDDPVGETHFHFRGKGLNADGLNAKAYEDMDTGGSLTNTRPFQMKKIHMSKNSKQEGVPHFSIIHNENIKKEVNNNKWAGRNFINDNDSLPWTR